MAEVGVKRRLEYDDADRQLFQSYFVKPGRKRGRPRKRKRGRKKKTKKKSTGVKSTDGHGAVIDLTHKKGEQLEQQLEGVVGAALLEQPRRRINWNTPENQVKLKRISISWIEQTDLYLPGETMHAFCEHVGVDRGVLRRYMTQNKKVGKSSKKARRRGRPTLLSRSVMEHLCEGACLHETLLSIMSSNYYK